MFLGHALVAFALAVLIAEWRGWPAERALAFGVATGLFAALPDVDVLYAAVAMNPDALVAGTQINPGEFWGTAHGVHRSMTHSLVAAAIAGPAFGLWTLRRPSDGESLRHTLGHPRTLGAVAVALAALAVIVIASVLADGFVGGFVMVAFALFGLGIATASRRYLGLSPQAIAVAAVAGLASHPWGDLLTGEPPGLLYPIDVQLLTQRVVLSSDPTLHLLATFAVELAAIAFGAVVVARYFDLQPRELVGRRAAVGGLYGAAAVVMVPPTIHLSYHFVFSILLVGAVCGAVRRSRRRQSRLRTLYHRVAGHPEATLRTTFTSLAAIAVALVSYGVVYLAIG